MQNNTTDDSYDYFIMAPNIEKRSRYSVKIIKDLYSIGQILAFDFDYFHLDNDKYKSCYEEVDSEVIDLQCEVIHLKNYEFEKNLNDRLSDIQHKKVAIDITGFSIPEIYRMLGFFRMRAKNTELDLYYTEPKTYVYENGYHNRYHPYIKPRKCAPINGYINSGTNQEEILVISLGFDGGLAKKVYDEIAQESQDVLETYAINGLPSYSAKLKDISLLNNIDLITAIDSGNVRFASASNPFSTYNTLVDLHLDHKGTLLDICTIGSKPMAVGGCLFALDYHNTVKVIYPFYNKTEFDVEEEPGRVWRYSI